MDHRQYKNGATNKIDRGWIHINKYKDENPITWVLNCFMGNKKPAPKSGFVKPRE
jgi:hypothetical protein